MSLQALDERVTDAANERTPPNRLMSLAADPSPRVRAAVAANPAVSGEMLAVLAADRSARVRLAVADSSRASSSLLLALSTDADVGVRCTVALHPNLDGEVQRAMAQDPDRRVRANLAARRDLPPGVGQLLRQDPDKLVVSTFASHVDDPTVLDALVHDASTDLRVAAAMNGHLTQAHQRTLARDRSSKVRAALAGTQGVRLPLDVLEDLARDSSVAVRWNLTVTRMPPSVLAILLEDPDEMNRGNAAQWQRRGEGSATTEAV